jgi:Fe-S cluster assembly protein SufD
MSSAETTTGQNAGSATGLASLAQAYRAVADPSNPAREKAWQRFSELGLPSRSVERWKYTSLKVLKEARFVWPQSQIADHTRDATELADHPSTFEFEMSESNYQLIFVDGIFSSAQSTLPDDASVIVRFERQAVGDRSPDVSDEAEPTHAPDQAIDADAMSCFHESVAPGRLLIEVRASTKLTKPLVIRYRLTPTAPEDGVDGVRLVLSVPTVHVVLAEDAHATLVECFESRLSDAFVSALSSLKLGRGARLEHVRIQDQASGVVHIGETRAQLARDANLTTTQFSFGAQLSRETLHVRLVEPGASVAMQGLNLGVQEQHFDSSTLVVHEVGDTLSSQIYKNVLGGSAHGVFNGRVKILKNAQRSNAAQVNRSLLLSQSAKIDSQPELEIDADEVKATHGATVAQVDEEQIFYFLSRGIPRAMAVEALSLGFAQDIAVLATTETTSAPQDRDSTNRSSEPWSSGFQRDLFTRIARRLVANEKGPHE